MKIGTWRWKDCQPYAPAAFTPRKYSWYSFLLEAESTPGAIVRPEGLCQWKITMTPSGTEPPTFRLVTQCLKGLVCKVKVKQSHYRPGQALRVPGGWGSQISRHSAQEGGKVVSPTHWPSLPPKKYSRYPFLLDAESTPGAIVRPEGLYQWKIPMTPSGIEHASFRLVAQCLNRLRYGVSPFFECRRLNWW